MEFPTPHLEKLNSTLANDKLPKGDEARVKAAIDVYKRWIANLDSLKGKPSELLAKMVGLLNEYRFYIDVDLIFDSKDDFLYRQKGQLKLDNSVIEEFLPRLLSPAIIPELGKVSVAAGPSACFSAVYFTSSLSNTMPGGGLAIKTKNQDFAIAMPLYLRASHKPDFSDSIQEQTYISYVSAECKTNLDKTMFQEAVATAHDTKSAVAGAKYYLLCEWLDMTPVSTAPTDIDEIIILRKAKRLNSNVRAQFSTAAGRAKHRDSYVKFLKDNPFSQDMFERLLLHVRELISNKQPDEKNVLSTGFF